MLWSVPSDRNRRIFDGQDIFSYCLLYEKCISLSCVCVCAYVYGKISHNLRVVVRAFSPSTCMFQDQAWVVRLWATCLYTVSHCSPQGIDHVSLHSEPLQSLGNFSHLMLVFSRVLHFCGRQPQTSYMLTTCQPHASHRPTSCHPQASHMPTTGQLHASHMPSTCQLQASHRPATCQPHSSHRPTTCQPHASYIPDTWHFTLGFASSSTIHAKNQKSVPLHCRLIQILFNPR